MTSRDVDGPLSDLDYRALARFRASLRQFLHFSEQAARAEGITPAQHQLLLAIRGHPSAGPPAVTDLADALRRQRHSVVELVDRAEEHALVISHHDSDDARRRLVALTDLGAEIIERLSALHRRELRDFEQDFTSVFASTPDHPRS